MFGFLKDKLKGALKGFSKEVEKEVTVEKKEVVVEEKISEKKIEVVPIKEKGFFAKIFGKKEKTIEEKEELLEELEGVETEKIEDVKIEKKVIVEEKKHHVKQEIKHPVKVEPKIEVKPEVKIETKTIPAIPAKVEIKKPEVKPVEVKEIKKEEVKKPEIKEEETITLKELKHHKEEPVIEEPKEEKKGFFTKITEVFTKFQLSDEKFEELFWELEVVMLENNVAVEVIDKIKKDLKEELTKGKVSRKGVEEMIMSTLKTSIEELFDIEKIDLINEVHKSKKAGKPYVIAMIGVNGAGKTTTLAKLTHKFQSKNFSVVLAASDTFRAAAIQQLEEHANKLDVRLIKHDYNSDPAAVAFDAIKYAQAHHIDVVIIDTAGRLHSNTNLMEELKKVIRVCKPDIKIFVGESITGNDCVEQAKEFDKIAGIDAIILSKADVDDKGGAAISISYVIGKPILYFGVGQTYDDLKEFDSALIIESLGL